MFNSKEVADINPSNSNISSLILEIGYSFLLIRLFNSLKSIEKRTVFLSFLGIIKAPAAHSESFILFKIPSFTNRSTSSLTVLNMLVESYMVFLNDMA